MPAKTIHQVGDSIRVTPDGIVANSPDGTSTVLSGEFSSLLPTDCRELIVHNEAGHKAGYVTSLTLTVDFDAVKGTDRNTRKARVLRWLRRRSAEYGFKWTAQPKLTTGSTRYFAVWRVSPAALAFLRSSEWVTILESRQRIATGTGTDEFCPLPHKPGKGKKPKPRWHGEESHERASLKAARQEIRR